MERFIVAGMGLPHFPEDLQPTLSEATQRAGVRLAFGPVRPVVGFGPRALFAAQIGPEMDRRAQPVVAGVAQVLVASLTGSDSDRSGSGQLLQSLRAGKAGAIIADLSEQTRAEFGASTREGAKQIVVGMPGVSGLDLPAINRELRVERQEGDPKGRSKRVRLQML